MSKEITRAMEGWISVCDNDTSGGIQFLRSIGVEILQENYKDEENDVYARVSDVAFAKLEPEWGRFIWGLS